MSAAAKHEEDTGADAVDYGEYGGDEVFEEGAGGEGGEDVDAEFAELQNMMSQMEEDNKHILAASSQAVTDAASAAATKSSLEEMARDKDERSVFVGNVDFSATLEEVASFFSSCGVVIRVTLLEDKHTGHRKG